MNDESNEKPEPETESRLVEAQQAEIRERLKRILSLEMAVAEKVFGYTWLFFKNRAGDQAVLIPPQSENKTEIINANPNSSDRIAPDLFVPPYARSIKYAETLISRFQKKSYKLQLVRERGKFWVWRASCVIEERQPDYTLMIGPCEGLTLCESLCWLLLEFKDYEARRDAYEAERSER